MLAVSLTGSCAVTMERVTVSTPVGATATVLLPAAAGASVTEGAAHTPVWAGGAYTPGAVGVTGAAAYAGGVAVTISSGGFSFDVVA